MRKNATCTVCGEIIQTSKAILLLGHNKVLAGYQTATSRRTATPETESVPAVACA